MEAVGEEVSHPVAHVQTAIGYFTAMCNSVCTRFGASCYSNPWRQSDFLEVWLGWCQANGTKMDKYLAEKMT